MSYNIKGDTETITTVVEDTTTTVVEDSSTTTIEEKRPTTTTEPTFMCVDGELVEHPAGVRFGDPLFPGDLEGECPVDKPEPVEDDPADSPQPGEEGEPVDELPMTGIGLGPLVLLASVLLGGGVELVRRHR